MPIPRLKIPDVARLLNKSHWTIRHMIKRGELPCYLVGGTWQFDTDELDAWLAARHQPGRATRLPEVEVPA